MGIDLLENSTILITGPAGSIGSHLSKRLLKYNPKIIRAFDNDDTGLTYLEDEFPEPEIFRPLLGSVRSYYRLKIAMRDVDYVFHCAALKHVALTEFNPFEVIETNVMGTQNVINAAIDSNVKKVIFTSSDKAVNPTNTMGASKLLGERLITSANIVKGSKNTKFASVRFGNVLGSRGSVIPRLWRQIKRNKTISVTNPEIKRFMMPITQAVELTLKAIELADGGEVIVFKMPVVKIGDLIEIIEEKAAKLLNIVPKKDIIGMFAGEKHYEELLSEDEVHRAIEMENMFILLTNIPELQKKLLNKYNNQKLGQISNVFNSLNVNPIDKKELEIFLEESEVFNHF
ncbi:MAG: polysaccharide biosynthesis protein [Candidatus Hodarchaeales archaeon]|jgi:FlaA1/EpsC-like NDP-sugar epimerase